MTPPDPLPAAAYQICRARCPVCKHRLGMLDQTVNRCRCGETYCSAHRSPEEHGCSYNYREARLGMTGLEKLVGVRVNKI